MSKSTFVVESANFAGVPLRSAIPLGGGLVVKPPAGKPSKASPDLAEASQASVVAAVEKRKRGRPRKGDSSVSVSSSDSAGSSTPSGSSAVSAGPVADVAAKNAKAVKGAGTDEAIPLVVADVLDVNIEASPVVVTESVADKEVAVSSPADLSYSPELGTVPAPVLVGLPVSADVWRFF